MSPLLYTDYNNIYDAERFPYGADFPATGNDYIVYTDLRNAVLAWVAYGGSSPQRDSWCHGFSLGTYEKWGYSVYSGRHVARVLADEYRRIPARWASAGDILVWRTSNPQRDYPHTAILKQLVLLPDGNPDLDRSLMDSKNGPAPIERNIPISAMTQQYGSQVKFYSRLR